jgi:hypothetical protein
MIDSKSLDHGAMIRAAALLASTHGYRLNDIYR